MSFTAVPSMGCPSSELKRLLGGQAWWSALTADSDPPRCPNAAPVGSTLWLKESFPVQRLMGHNASALRGSPQRRANLPTASPHLSLQGFHKMYHHIKSAFYLTPFLPTATSSFNGRSKTNGHYMPCPANLLSPLFLITPVLTGRVGQTFHFLIIKRNRKKLF